MGADGDVDTTRAVVKTYLPEYQKQSWREHADELGMTQSEYVKSMVQAGRRGFLDETADGKSGENKSGEPDKDDQLEAAVQRILSTEVHRSWDELVEAITDDIEDQLEETMADLQDRNRVRYSGRNGGYTLVDS